MRGAGVGRGLGVGAHLPVHGVGVGVGVAVALGVAVGVMVGVGVGVGVGEAKCAQYRPPVLKACKDVETFFAFCSATDAWAVSTAPQSNSVNEMMLGKF